MNGSNLTPRQRRSIAALLSCRNIPEAARVAKVGERTLYRWMTKTSFRAALVQAEEEAIDAATRRLLGLQNAAIDTLGNVLKDVDNSPNVRISAARSVLDFLLKLRELRNVESRLIALEQVIGALNHESSKN